MSGALGTLLSQAGPRMPTGPLLVLAATGLFAVSLMAAPAALLARLHRKGLVAPALAEGWALTPAGLRAAHGLVRERRLWEVFLMHEGELGGAPLDRDGAALSGPEAAALRPALERLLRLHGLEPALVPASPVSSEKED